MANRFDFYYTPKSASWLNIIEPVAGAIEFSALAKGFLHQRILNQEELEKQVLALI